MNWRIKLVALEQKSKWDEAIIFMEKVISKEPFSIDAYLSIQYLLMNLLVEEDYDDDKYDTYTTLLLHYFKEAYEKFSSDPSYLYYTGRIAAMSEWYFGLERHDSAIMIEKASELDPKNPVYLWSYYYKLDIYNPEERKKLIIYIKSIFQKNSAIKRELDSKGSLGKYIFDIMANWGKEILHKSQFLEKGLLTASQAYDATREFLQHCIVSKYDIFAKEILQYMLSRTYVDLNIWKLWLKTFNCSEALTKSDAYQVMILFLKEYNWKIDQNKLATFLKKIAYISEKKESFDADYWLLWKQSVKTILRIT